MVSLRCGGIRMSRDLCVFPDDRRIQLVYKHEQLSLFLARVPSPGDHRFGPVRTDFR
jgi:hypothetical protein